MSASSSGHVVLVGKLLSYKAQINQQSYVSSILYHRNI